MATIDLKQDGMVRVWDERVYHEHKVSKKNLWKKFEQLTGLKFVEMSEPGYLDDITITVKKGRKKLTLEGYQTKYFVTIHDVELLEASEQPEDEEEPTGPKFTKGDQVWVNYYKKDRLATIKRVDRDRLTLEVNHKGKKKELRKSEDEVKPVDFEEVY